MYIHFEELISYSFAVDNTVLNYDLVIEANYKIRNRK